jgi:nicotinamidase/pyrazinamidase
MKTICWDVDTQLDFLLPAGALSVPGAAHVLERVAALNHWAAGQGYLVVSTMDAHSEDDAEFRVWPAHCVAGTLGQRKPESTLLEARARLTLEARPIDIAGARQVLVEKRALDCFTNPNVAALLRALGAERAIVYGVVTEYCVQLAAAGLLQAGLQVEIVTDAVQALRRDDGAAALAALAQRGARLTSLAAVIGSARAGARPGGGAG